MPILRNFASPPKISSKKIGRAAAAGNLFAWGGGNARGQLGTNDTVTRSSPVQVGPLNDWKQPSPGGQFTICTKKDGTLWSWGFGANGRTGLNIDADRSSPVQIGALTNWDIPTNGENFCIVKKTDGTLWSWGYNGQGRLGRDYATTFSSPIQIGSDTNWATPSSGGGGSVLCVKTTGALFVWGSNSNGQLGVGDTSPRNAGPVQLGSLTNWSKPSNGASTSMCVKTDGTLWMWGKNSVGQLGQNNTTNTSSPVQVGSLTDWATPSTYNSAFNPDIIALCVKTNGTLWAWGSNTYGQLGVGDTVSRSSPTQVGALTNWATPAAGQGSALCTKTNGTLFSWGTGVAVGDGNTIQRSSPVQIGTQTNWANPGSGYFQFCSQL